MSKFSNWSCHRALKYAFSLLFIFAALTGCSIFNNTSSKLKPAILENNISAFEIRQVWTSRVGTGMKVPMGVNVSGNLVTIASADGTIASIDSTTGHDVWRISLGERLSAGVGSDGKMAAVVLRTNVLIGIDSGSVRWREQLTAQVFTPPLVAGGRIFVLAADRSIAAYDAASGQRLWIQRRVGEPLILRHSGVLMAIEDTLVVGSSGSLLGLDPNSGSIRWDARVGAARGTNDVERLVELVGPIARIGTNVCVRAYQSAVGCVDAKRGDVSWTHAANGAEGVDGDKDVLIGVEGNGKVIAWRRSNGERIWETDRLLYRKLTAPLLLGRSVVIGDESGLLHFLSKVDGLPLNRLQTDASGLVNAPVVSGATLIVFARNGNVYGYRPD